MRALLLLLGLVLALPAQAQDKEVRMKMWTGGSRWPPSYNSALTHKSVA